MAGGGASGRGDGRRPTVLDSMQEEGKLGALRTFLASEYNDEGLLFLMEVDKLEKLDAQGDAFVTEAERLFDVFVDAGGEKALNLSGEDRSWAQRQRGEHGCTMALFRRLVEAVSLDLEMDALPRFVNAESRKTMFRILSHRSSAALLHSRSGGMRRLTAAAHAGMGPSLADLGATEVVEEGDEDADDDAEGGAFVAGGQLPLPVFSMLYRDAVGQEESGWQFHREKSGVTCWRKQSRDGLTAHKAECMLPCSPRDVHDLLWRDEVRPRWDALWVEGRVVDRVDESMKVLHYVYKRPRALAKRRDFCVMMVRRCVHNGTRSDGTWTESMLSADPGGQDPATDVRLIVSSSVAHPEAPEQADMVRAHMVASGFTILPWKGHADRCKLVHVQQVDPKGKRITVHNYVGADSVVNSLLTIRLYFNNKLNLARQSELTAEEAARAEEAAQRIQQAESGFKIRVS